LGNRERAKSLLVHFEAAFSFGDNAHAVRHGLVEVSTDLETQNSDSTVHYSSPIELEKRFNISTSRLLGMPNQYHAIPSTRSSHVTPVAYLPIYDTCSKAKHAPSLEKNSQRPHGLAIQVHA
jgi:hypothetical protein